jgi:hypothetical protein
MSTQIAINHYALCSKSLRYLGSPNLHSVPLTLYGEQAVGKRHRTSPDRMNFVSETFSSELLCVFFFLQKVLNDK